MSEPASHPLPFVRVVKGPRGVSRTTYWTAHKSSGEREKDCRAGRDLGLTYMAYEHGRQQTDPDAPPIIGSIVDDMIASGDRSGVAKGFVLALVECSRFNWTSDEVSRFRQHYEQADREYDEAMAAVRRKKRPPVPAVASTAITA